MAIDELVGKHHNGLTLCIFPNIEIYPIICSHLKET